MATVKRVLVADDEPGIRSLLEAILNELGVESVIVPNGLEAIQQLALGNFDLVITDLHMPFRGGVDVARCVREHHPGSRVLLMSATWTREEQVLAAGIPCDMILSKPFTIPELMNRLRELLGPPRA